MILAIITPCSLLYNVLSPDVLRKVSPFVMTAGYIIPWSFVRYATNILYLSLNMGGTRNQFVKVQADRVHRKVHLDLTRISAGDNRRRSYNVSSM